MHLGKPGPPLVIQIELKTATVGMFCLRCRQEGRIHLRSQQVTECRS